MVSSLPGDSGSSFHGGDGDSADSAESADAADSADAAELPGPGAASGPETGAGQAAEQVGGQATDQGGQAVDQAIGQGAEHVADQAVEQAVDQAVDQAVEQVADQAVDQAVRTALAATERWFVRAGVPHFVEARAGVARLPRPLRPFAALLDLLRLGLMLAFWTVRRVVAEAREMGHLAVRALPLLALFGMVIFFTADFWQVAAALDSGWLWATAAFFVVLIQAFLIARLPEEFGTLPKACTPDRIRASCAATPLAEFARSGPELDADPRLGPAQRRNMFVYLLLSQTIQVSLLSWMVFFFYVVFGAMAIRPEVLTEWFKHPVPDARVLGVHVPGVSSALLHVAVLLAGLSALYFAITALTDAVYRREFFDRTLAELDRAIHLRAAYLSARRRS